MGKLPLDARNPRAVQYRKSETLCDTGAAISTIKDVARRTGLSLSTISKYLNGGNVREENRLAIDAAIEELDYSVNVFARSLKANRSMTVGVLLPTISSPFFGRVVASLELDRKSVV